MNVSLGDRQSCYVVAEIGINHNGSLDIARKLIDAAADAGCDAVKFQKRDIDLCYTKEELDKPRESPWGTTTRQQKEGLEFGLKAYELIDQHCALRNIQWFASPWDCNSVQFLRYFDLPCYKIASASLTDHALIEAVCAAEKPIMLSTGMSTLDEIDEAVKRIACRNNRLILMHCTSTYPSRSEELNLRCIPMLRNRFDCLVGYSGHEVGLQTTLAAVALGACVIERHITLDRTMYGSDQSASIEPHGFKQLVRDIREIEKALGDGRKRVYESELPIKAKLRKTPAI